MRSLGLDLAFWALVAAFLLCLHVSQFVLTSSSQVNHKLNPRHILRKAPTKDSMKGLCCQCLQTGLGY